MAENEHNGMLVVSAHAADYVWRAGGVIAKYIQAGRKVHVVVLSYGIRGESNDVWKQPGQTYDSVKAARKTETEKAAAILGVKSIDFWDLPDYPMAFDAALEDRMVRIIRQTRPQAILTHDKHDVLNPDHNAVHDFVFRCSVMSNSRGVPTDGMEATRQMQLFGFEPHQTELSGFVPDCMIDITSVYEKKVRAMQCFTSQAHLIEYYTQRAIMRGNHARRLSGHQEYKYAESFASVFPYVGKMFWS